MGVIAVIGIVLLVGVMLALPIAGLLDLRRHPDWAFERAGENRQNWTLMMAATFFVIIPIVSLGGAGASAIYWTSRRKKILAAEAFGPPVVPQLSTSPVPGWYADPGGQARLRWWDGAVWTAHVAS